MEIVVHRINSIKNLNKVPTKYGCEIDIRSQGSHLILNHEPYEKGDRFVDYLDNYNHGLLILNIKEAGIENDVLSAVRKRGLLSYFLLDVEFPFIYKASRTGERSIAIRFSEDEPIELVQKYNKLVDWVWIDTISKLPVDNNILHKLKGMKTCLVCPERWGRPEDIEKYIKQMKLLDFMPDAVMTRIELINKWENIC